MICLTHVRIYKITHFLTIVLSLFDLMLALCQLVERKMIILEVNSDIKWLSHVAIHGSVSCLMSLVIYRAIFVIRPKRKIRWGIYKRKTKWTSFCYIAPLMYILFLNIFFNYSCGFIVFGDRHNRLMTFVSSFILPLICLLMCASYINWKVAKSPKRGVMILNYKIATTSLVVYRLIWYLVLWTPSYVSI